ncbi:hypothetical protein V8E51_008690 [Hyaloscypha variabilis]
MAGQEPYGYQTERILAAQQLAPRNAGKWRREVPRDLPSRNQIIDEFMMVKRSNHNAPYVVMITVIGEPYHPSTAPLSSLKKIGISELKIEMNHRGSYLLLRCLCYPMLEDEQGTANPFALYLQEPEYVRPAESILKQNQVFILKEPYFKVGTNGQYAIRVDHPTDIIWLSEDDPRSRSEKALYRGSLALYCLQRFDEASEVLRVLEARFPKHAAAKHELARTNLRIEEQKTGIRDSPGRGKGLFTTKAVKAGDLLLCEKAFSYCFAAPPGELMKAKSISPASVLLDLPTNRSYLGTQADIIRDVSNKLMTPSLKSDFEALFHGSYESVPSNSADGNAVVDTFLVAKIVNFNCSACPLTSKDVIQDPEWNRASKLPSTIQHDAGSTRSLYRTTGLWLKASFINHSCIPTCWVVGKASEDPGSLNKRLLDGWGFECSCPICIEDRELNPSIKNRRLELFQEFDTISKNNLKRKRDFIQKLESTYSRPPTEVPRPQMWLPLFSLVPLYAMRKHGNPERLIKQVLATFTSDGYIIKGAELLDVQDYPPSIKVEKWGLPDEGATSAWLTLRNAYKALGDTHRAEQAKEFARITWMLLVGEDVSFVWENPPKA